MLVVGCFVLLIDEGLEVGNFVDLILGLPVGVEVDENVGLEVTWWLGDVVEVNVKSFVGIAVG